MNRSDTIGRTWMSAGAKGCRYAAIARIEATRPWSVGLSLRRLLALVTYGMKLDV